MRRLEDRWDRRRGPESVTVEAAITIDAAPEAVWQFLITPEAIVITSNDVSRAFYVPGTVLNQPGAELVVLREADGYLSAELHEIVVFEPVSRLVSVCRSLPVGNWAAQVLEQGPQGGTVVRTRVSFEAPPELAQMHVLERETQKTIWDELRRTKRAIESGVQFPSQRDGHGR